jgi:hypothetical protein
VYRGVVIIAAGVDEGVDMFRLDLNVYQCDMHDRALELRSVLRHHALSLRERVGVRGFQLIATYDPLTLALSLWERGLVLLGALCKKDYSVRCAADEKGKHTLNVSQCCRC